MSIEFHERERLFAITSGGMTYTFMVHGVYDRLVHLYYGKAIPAAETVRLFADHTCPRSQSPLPAEGKPGDGSLNILPQEFSSFGVGDYRRASARIRNADGNGVTDAKYVSHRIFKGKPELPGLPASFGDDAETLEVTLRDETTGVEFTLLYSIFGDLPVIARSCRAVNRGEKAVTVEKLASLTLDFPKREWDLVSFHGGWSRERHFQRAEIKYGVHELESVRGLSGHSTNPFFILAERDARESHGAVYGQMLLYSGNFKAEVERDLYDGVRIQFGINPDRFAWRLEPGESLQAPEALTAYSPSGFEDLSLALHDFLREHVIRGGWSHRPRPIVINNWEATRFNFTEEQILDFARRAADLGMDMLVLDDGWFGKRDDDTSSLGDWFVFAKKLPHGLPALVEKVNSLGLKFGLWFEPEMVSPDSELLRKHPDWALHVPDRPSSTGRNQLVLDMSRPEVIDNLFAQMTAILDSANIEYVKWDANRPLSEVGSAALPPERQGEVAHRFVLGTYSLLERLRQRYPDMLFEGCASGGGRFDAGMLYYTPQIWTSDDTDAVERLHIQYGTSFGYPASSMGAHVSAVPNRQVGRVTPLSARGIVALAGAFGYELDPGAFTPEEAAEVKHQIALRRECEQLLLDGDYLRLSSPETDNLVGWEFVAKDKREFVVSSVRVLARPNARIDRIFPRRLLPDALYTDTESGERFSGAFLMNAGLAVPASKGDFNAFRWHFRVE